MKPTLERGRWGILGGTFDPVHLGHLTLARELQRFKRLDGVLFVPSVSHPFKGGQCQASFAQRVDMLRLAVAGYEPFQVSQIEQEQHLSGYTVDTVRALKRLYPRTDFYFLMGADLLADMEKWYHPDQLLREVTLLVGSRPGHELRLPAGFPPERVELVPSRLIGLSSTMVRARIKDRADSDELDRLVPAAVRRYIQEKGLYR